MSRPRIEVSPEVEARLHPCPAGDECALGKGAIHCFHCGRNWPPDETWTARGPKSATEEADKAMALRTTKHHRAPGPEETPDA